MARAALPRWLPGSGAAARHRPAQCGRLGRGDGRGNGAGAARGRAARGGRHRWTVLLWRPAPGRHPGGGGRPLGRDPGQRTATPTRPSIFGCSPSRTAATTSSATRRTSATGARPTATTAPIRCMDVTAAAGASWSAGTPTGGVRGRRISWWRGPGSTGTGRTIAYFWSYWPYYATYYRPLLPALLRRRQLRPGAALRRAGWTAAPPIGRVAAPPARAMTGTPAPMTGGAAAGMGAAPAPAPGRLDLDRRCLATTAGARTTPAGATPRPRAATPLSPGAPTAPVFRSAPVDPGFRAAPAPAPAPSFRGAPMRSDTGFRSAPSSGGFSGSAAALGPAAAVPGAGGKGGAPRLVPLRGIR